MLLQMPAFFILYSVIRGMTNTVTHSVYATTLTGKKVATQVVVAEPRYIPNPSKMRTDIVRSHGQLNSFGMDFSDKLLSHHSSLFVAIPYLVLVVGAVGLQYLQMSRLNARNPQASQANPQAAMLQKYMPLIFGFIYLNVAAILNVYFIVSSGIRILTQEILFRKGIVAGPPPPSADGAKAGPKTPVVDRSERSLPKPKASGSAPAKAGPRPGGSGGSNGKTRRPASADAAIDAAATEKTRSSGSGGTKQGPSSGRNGNGSSNGSGSANGNGRRRPTSANGSRAAGNGTKGSTNGSNGAKPVDGEGGSGQPKEHPRSKAKRERKAR
jgi:hypothetical protein